MQPRGSGLLARVPPASFNAVIKLFVTQDHVDHANATLRSP